MSKSYKLDKRLKELLAPMGFMKIPAQRSLIRLCGDGIFQGVMWDWCPNASHQYLLIFASSIWQRSEILFRPHLLNPQGASALQHPIDSSRFYWDGKVFLYNTEFQTINSEDDEINHFVKNYLPLVNGCVTQRMLYDIIIKSQIALYGKPLYNRLNNFNHSLFFGDLEFARNIIDGCIKDSQLMVGQLVMHIASYELQKKMTQRDKYNFERFQRGITEEKERMKSLIKLYELIDRPETIKPYLDKCKKQNLEDFSELMKGKANDIIAKYV